MSAEFVYSEDDRSYYRVTVVGPQHKDYVFDVWISGQQELQFGLDAPVERDLLIGLCQGAIKQWCVKFPNRLPRSGVTKELSLNDIFFKPN